MKPRGRPRLLPSPSEPVVFARRLNGADLEVVAAAHRASTRTVHRVIRRESGRRMGELVSVLHYGGKVRA